MRTLILLAALALGACGDPNAAQCSPRCTDGKLCCSEPTHSADGGAPSAFFCVAPSSDGSCPLQP
jgi:hypothetical protein